MAAEALVFERLPLGDLSKCKLVSKEWKQEILALSTRWVQKAVDLSLKEAVLVVYVDSTETFEAWFASSGHRLKIHGNPFPDPLFNYLASCQSLVFGICGDEEEEEEAGKELSLWIGNPATTSWKELPWPANLIKDRLFWSTVWVIVDSQDSSYKIVILVGGSPWDYNFNPAKVAFVFDTKRWEWKEWENSNKMLTSLDDLKSLMSHAKGDFVLTAQVRGRGRIEVYHIEEDMQGWKSYVIDAKLPDRVKTLGSPHLFLHRNRWILVASFSLSYGVWELDDSGDCLEWKFVSEGDLTSFFGWTWVRKVFNPKETRLSPRFCMVLQEDVITITCDHIFPPVTFDLESKEWHHMGLGDPEKDWGVVCATLPVLSSAFRS